MSRSPEFRELMSRFPTGVAVVTSVDTDGRPFGMTCSSLASVCLSPPTLLVCLHTASATRAVILRRRGFAINLLHEGGYEVARVFSSPVPDRFADVRWQGSPAGLPWLDDVTTASGDCRVIDTVEQGDHTVVFGQVDRLVVRQGAPLLYGLRCYSTLRVARALR